MKIVHGLFLFHVYFVPCTIEQLSIGLKKLGPGIQKFCAFQRFFGTGLDVGAPPVRVRF